MLATFDATVHEIAPTFWIAEVPQVKFDVVRLVRGLFPLGQTATRVARHILLPVRKGHRDARICRFYRRT